MVELTHDDETHEAQGGGTPAEQRGRGRLRTLTRRLGTVLAVCGVLFLAYGATIYLWRDPVTDLYARWKQHQLAAELNEAFAQYRADLPPAESAPTETAPAEAPSATGDAQGGTPAPPDTSVLEQQIREAARKFYLGLELGQPLGRITIPRLDVHPVFVNGTRWGADLSRGPGRYTQTWLPGMGKVTAIAGHRTTFGAPFRHIDELEPGDLITLELPYGTFRYRVFAHQIVDDHDWSIIRPRGFDMLVLSACHPLYSASQRWIVFARLREVATPDGQRLQLPPAVSAEPGDKTPG
jgi:sortase A